MNPVTKGKMRFEKLHFRENMEKPCTAYGPSYCCNNFNRFQCNVQDNSPGAAPGFGGPDTAAQKQESALGKMMRKATNGIRSAANSVSQGIASATNSVTGALSGGRIPKATGSNYKPLPTPGEGKPWPNWVKESGLTGVSKGGEYGTSTIPLAFRLNEKNQIEFALDAYNPPCNIDVHEYVGRTKICTLYEQGGGFNIDSYPGNAPGSQGGPKEASALDTQVSAIPKPGNSRPGRRLLEQRFNSAKYGTRRRRRKGADYMGGVKTGFPWYMKGKRESGPRKPFVAPNSKETIAEKAGTPKWDAALTTNERGGLGLSGTLRGQVGTLDGTDVLCNNARSALMRCSSGGNRGAFIPWGLKGEQWHSDHLNTSPLDFSSQEAIRDLKSIAATTRTENLAPLIGKWKDPTTIGPFVEPLYNPIWRPHFEEHVWNDNFKPRHLCVCTKPFYIENNAAGCKPIRVYDGYNLAGQKCNAHVVDYGEMPAKYTKEYLCCNKWTEFFEGLARIQYCDKGDGSEPKVTVQMRVRMVPLKGFVPVTFYPPARALMGTCNSYVRMLSLGLKYGGMVFRQELKRAAEAQLEDWTEKAHDAAIEARVEIFRNNREEVKNKMRNRQIQWQMYRADRDDLWHEAWSEQDDEYTLWHTDWCYTSLITLGLGMLFQDEYYGGRSSYCLLFLQKKKENAKRAFVMRYGMATLPPKTSLMSRVKKLGNKIAAGAKAAVGGLPSASPMDRRRTPRPPDPAEGGGSEDGDVDEDP